MSRTTIILVTITSVCIATLSVLAWLTAPRIEAQQRQVLLNALQEILPAKAYDNDLTEDTITVLAPAALGRDMPVTVYRARLDDEPVAAIFAVVAPDGYSGPITLLLGVHTDGRVAAVRTLAHTETPGLGDAIERDVSDWVTHFSGRSLGDPPASDWAVKKDGGVFDQFTGATITPRAVVEAIQRALAWFEPVADELFGAPSGSDLNFIDSSRKRNAPANNG